MRHPSAKDWPSLLKGGKEVTWGSKNSGWQLVFYEKADDVLRIELRLHGRPLARLVDVNQPPDFGKVWRVLQAELAPLTPIRLPEEKRHSYAEILASLSPETRRSAEELRRALRTLPFSPFAPVRRQFCALLRAINGCRKTAGLELLSWDALRLRRRSIKPFGDDQRPVLTAEQESFVKQPPSPPTGSGE